MCNICYTLCVLKGKEERRERMPESKAKKAWMKANTTHVGVKLTNNTDGDIIQYLSQQPSKQGTIKQALREKMARETQKAQGT